MKQLLCHLKNLEYDLKRCIQSLELLIHQDDIRQEIEQERIAKTKQEQDKIIKRTLGPKITKAQLEELHEELEAYPELVKDCKKAFHIDELKDMPKEKFKACMKKIRELKRKYEELSK